ncbi:MAG TPA: polysaccharide biosynthesis/export family protein [Gemmataceae bacterium]|nr:polysaccharide biosynthesis/export family protein [Gemmataceae bacterium]
MATKKLETLVSLGVMLATSLLLAACAELPSAGPTTNQIETRWDPNWIFYEVKVNSLTLPYLTLAREARFPDIFERLRYRPSLALRPGDSVALTIFETGGPSLFSNPTAVPLQTPSNSPYVPPQSSATTIAPQIIEPNGTVNVPFAGAVVVAGKTPLQASNFIAQSLSKETRNPQVVVTLVNNVADTASVGGDVNRAGPFPLSLRGERLLDAIDYAGGVKYPLSEMDIRLIRRHTAATVPLQAIINDPNENVVIEPNDEIVAIHNPKTFTVLGATTRVAQYNFDTPTVTLAEAVARAGGPTDVAGNPAGVYVFRREPTPLAASILQTVAAGPDAVTNFGQPAQSVPLVGPTTLMVYRVDMNTADGYFLAQKIQVHDKDIIVITDAVGTQLLKLTTIARGFSGILFDLGAGGIIN